MVSYIQLPIPLTIIIMSRMKSLLLVSLLFLLSWNATSQDSIQFLHEWKPGEKLSFRFSRLKSVYSQDTLYSTSSFIYDVTLRVNRVTADECLMELSYSGRTKDYQEFKKAPANGFVGTAIASFARELYAFKSLKIIYTIDRTGAFKEIKNGREVKEYISSALDAFQRDQNVSRDFKNAVEQFGPSFLSDDFVLYSFLLELHAFHLAYGTKWAMGKQTIEIEMPNPLNGEPLPGILTTELKKEQKRARSSATYELVMQQEIDSDKMTKILKDKITDTYQKINKPNPGTAPAESTLIYSYTIVDELVKNVHVTKRVNSAGWRATEQYILE